MPSNENWEKFHNRYGTIDDPANRRGVMQSALSAMGSSCRSLKDLAGATVTPRESDPSPVRPKRGAAALPRSSSARVLAVAGKSCGRAAPSRTASGGLQALRAGLQQRNKSKSFDGSSPPQRMLSGGSQHSQRQLQRPRTRSPHPVDRRRARSPTRPTITAGGDE